MLDAWFYMIIATFPSFTFYFAVITIVIIVVFCLFKWNKILFVEIISFTP